ncbi:uncharacterized protein LY89DRAFT_719586 [Mollisia scopiformis]|uniref:NB-ARC domain-containing protein n=1 Tax=Mollisia scopiformis TaxID=149040 RepID=A0A194X6V3_MOLSC|nr:uncharacterized protein LY89DRAFT_719586 [Mollisia scopiformis]KUJ15903.1 hypothetical protein LY89DRAFT_719586 [Mollisia scopiformis]
MLGVEVAETSDPILLILSETIVKVFTNLLDLWINTCSTIRKNPNWEPWKQQMTQQIPNTQHPFGISVNTTVVEDGVSFPLKVLPYPAYNGFFGRKELLARMNKELDPGQASTGNGNDVNSILLHGTGGVGKTQSALAYAHLNPARFDAIFWVRSDLDADIQASFSNIALALNLHGAKRDGDAQQDENFLYFTRWLGQQAATKNGKRWLMIFDNCDKIGDIWPKYIPKTKGSVLITSRSQSVKLPDSVILPVQPFGEDEGLKLMKKLLYSREEKQLSPSEESSLLNLLRKFDGLPLGIKVIVALMLPRIDRKSKHPITSFAKFYDQNARKMLTRVERATDYDHDEHREVGQVHVLDNVWQLSFTSLDPDALSVLGMISFMAPQDISISWLNLVDKDVPPSQTVLSVCTKPFELDWAIVNLAKAALINKQNVEGEPEDDDIDTDAIAEIRIASGSASPTSSAFESTSSLDADDEFGKAKISIHRLVQEALIYSRSTQERQTIFDAAIRVVSMAFPKQINGETLEGETETCSRLIPHVMSLASRYIEFESHATSPLEPTNELGSLLKSCIWFTYEKGERKTALYLLQLAYKICQDKESEVYADLQFKAGGIYLDQNDLAHCRQAWDEARGIYSRLQRRGNISAKHSLTWVLHALGNLESADGHLDEALSLYAEADEDRRQEQLAQPWREGLAAMTLGRAYFLKGEFETALEKFSEAESIFNKDYQGSTWMAYLTYAHGNVELARDNLTEAKTKYIQSQDCWTRSAPSHLGLSACYYKLGCIEFRQQEYLHALKYFRKALRIAKFQAQGDQARILRKQAEVQDAGGFVDQAAVSRKEAEDTRSKITGQAGKSLEDTDAAWDSLVCIFWR